jgi:AsmA protein
MFSAGPTTTLLAGVLAVFIASAGTLRAPLERVVLQKTGRELAIHGDLTVKFGWPQVRLRGATLTFANPAWTQERYMVAATASRWRSMCPSCCNAISPSPKCACSRPRCSWRRLLTGARTGCWTWRSRTRTPASASGASRWTAPSWGMTTSPERPAFGRRCRPARWGRHSATADLSSRQTGATKGWRSRPKAAAGRAGAADTTHPYPLKFEASAGRTQVKADGTLTGLLALDAIDMRMTLRGDNLEQLYPLLGIAFPATRPYLTEGHLLHAGSTWRFEQFTGRIGTSDIAGFVQVVTGGKRPALTAGLTSRVLALEDLGPVIGARPGSAARAAASLVGRAHVLPDRSRPTVGTRWTPRLTERNPCATPGPAAGEPGDPPQLETRC